ncbi:MAG: OmpA family protein [Halothiobacillus sp.]
MLAPEPTASPNTQAPNMAAPISDDIARQHIEAELRLAEQKAAFARPWHEGWDENPREADDDQYLWLVTLADLMTLLMAMFVMLAAFAYQSRDSNAQLPASSGSTQEAQKVNATPTPQTGPMATTQSSPGQAPTQGNIPQAGNALIGSAGTQPPETPEAPTANPPPTENPLAGDAAQTEASALFSGLGNDVDVSVIKGRVNLRVKDNILFSSGNSDLSPAGQGLLNRLAERLKAGNYPIAVQGHTDNRPIHTAQFPSNWELSAGRAAAVVQQLIHQGVAPDRLSATGFADTHPIASNDTPTGRAENRRVDLELQLPASMLPKAALPAPATPPAP